MRYRKFGRLNWEVSSLGFGIMRLPVRNGDYSDIDEDSAMKMLRAAVDGGVNYLDTAWNYHREMSEGFLGRALSSGYRDRVRIATKMPCWLVEKAEDFDRFFDTQMERLQAERIDFYLLHALQGDWWDKIKGLGYLQWAEKKVSDGHIGHLGFSFHDKFPLFKRIIDDYDSWTLVMLQHNYMDAEQEAGTAGVRYARERDIAVIAMEPLRGGQLAKEPPAPAAKVFGDCVPGRSAAEWGLRWLWDQEEITLVLSGMSTLEHVEQNMAVAGASHPGCMSTAEHQAIDKVRDFYLSRASIGCTHCRYCMPCPQGVAIPFVFEHYNMAKMYDDLRMAKAHYAFLDQNTRADSCNACGRCMDLCPQHLDIVQLLRRCHELLQMEEKRP